MIKRGSLMSDNGKAIFIQSILLVTSGIIAIVLNNFFKTKGPIELVILYVVFPTTVLGLYFIFGKYVYINGLVITKFRKITSGIFLVFLLPSIYFILMFF